MILIDLTHTSHTHARTGVQRVSRSLFEAARKQTSALALTHDPFEGAWRSLRKWELANLRHSSPAERRGAKWPLTQRWLSRFRRFAGSVHSIPEASAGLIVPEIFSAATAAAFPTLFKHIDGPKIAIFHDAIALKIPELTPQKTVARFPSYLQELLLFDGIAAVSEDSRQTLTDYWRWLGVSNHPPLRTIALGFPEQSKRAPPSSIGSAKPIVLSIGSIEGRKNHVALLDACENLWSDGFEFELRLIGLAHPETGRLALQRIDALKRAGRRLRYEGPVSDEALARAYETCAFTVYPSLMEGFGLPVFESIYRGKPCVCSGAGALGEAAKGGGCLTLETMDSAHLTSALRDMLSEPILREKLAADACLRPQRTWCDYTQDLLLWIGEIRKPHF